ncbi:restriction endonuclease subunit S [uncultured Treponema sp.]|uniref:restriction endonuclease subunit S n=1 Tax=uncultured Treponema sp. TaxID=162155 RepID=UPI002591DED1|nr:restriction endonuclease subunit S [uncultured Treponema sp.]
MKDSGIDWIGKIPDEWEIEKGKRIFAQRNERGNKINLELLSPTQKYGVIPQTLYEELTTYSAVKLKEGTDLSQLKTVHKGDYCISLRSFQGGFEYSKYEGVVSPAYQIFYAIKNIDECYYKYLFKDQTFIAKMNSFTMSLRDGKNIAFSDFGNTYIPLPPLSEQTKIANFLDKKCAQIDSIIEESKKSIEEYKSWKQSVIFEAVTGKNLSCKKKDSGIEWLGEIPEEWEVQRLKSYFNFKKGLPITKENLEDSGISVISYGQIHSKNNNGVSICNELIRFVDKSYLKSNSESLVKKGDFIFADTSEDLEGCGNCAYVNSDEIIFAGYHTIIFSSKYQNENKYLAYLFLTDAWRTQIRCNCSGVKLFSITKKILSKVSIILPPISEQESVAKALDAKCAQIDSLISEKQSLIKDLAEYKKSLIFEAVTGKRRV